MGNVVLIACTNVGRSMIEAILTSEELKDINLSGVVNLSAEAAINKANYDSYADLFINHQIKHYYCTDVNEPECIAFIKSCEPDIIIQSGWSQKFNNELLNLPKYACIGEHPAPLPKGRGAACINWAIITGEHEWGDTFFKMEEQYDTGVIYSQEFFNIELYDDVKTVYDKVAYAAVTSIKKHLPNWVSGSLIGKQQDSSVSTHYPRRRPSDGLFSFDSDTALNIYNHIRGQARPYPGAFFELKKNGAKKKVYVWKCRLGDTAQPGEYVMKCKEGSLVLQRVQEEGCPEIWAEDYFSYKGLVV